MIEELVAKLASDPHNPAFNLELGLAYDGLGQLASAVSCYLRTAEYGYDTHPSHVYAALLRISECMNSQKERDHSVTGSLLQAIAYMPSRPEAWFLLARYHERAGNWQECYSFASVGKTFSEFHTNDPLPCPIDYPGKFVFDFEIAVSAWWVGRKDESLLLFNRLLTTEELPAEYLNTCLYNLQRIGA